MTSMTLNRAKSPALVPRRVVTVARVLLADAWVLPGWPLAIMGSSFVINVLIFSMISGAVQQPSTGGLASIYVLQMFVCWQLVHQYFSFAVGMNVSRRTYYGAVALISVVQSLFFGIFLYSCAAIERATGGWGVDLSFFAPLPLMRGPWFEAIAVYLVPMILMSCLGFFFGSISKRWGGNGIFVLTVLSILVFGGIAVLVTLLDAWPSVGAWLAGRSWLSITVGWSLIPAALAAVGAWLVLRRAVP